MPCQNTLISPALLRGEKRSFFFYVWHPHKIFQFLLNICEYYQGSSNALSTVFVLITDFLMPFQNTLISRLSSAEKCDHFSFISATLRKRFYFLRTYVNIIKVLTMGLNTIFVLITDFHMPFQNTLISRLSSPLRNEIIFLLKSATLTKSSYFFRTYVNYHHGSSNARSTVFVLITDFLMPF